MRRGAHRFFPRALLVLAAIAAAGCVDAVVPNAGVPTLDDAVADDFIAVSAGREHSCALISDGTAYCWGSNEGGQLGIAADTTRCRRNDRPIPCEKTPVAVSGGLKFRQVSAGGLHTCGLTLDGHVYCWGDNLLGELGDPAIRASAVPVAILSSDLFTAVAAGGSHSCALRTDGAAFCWGANDVGQLGIATVGPGAATPEQVQTSQRFSSISAGSNGTCARVPDGGSYCWGSIWVSRQNGDELTRPEGNVRRVARAPAFRAIAVGGTTTCAIGLDDAGYCWEANPSGTIGDGSTEGNTAPQSVHLDVRLVAISVGGAHACAIAQGGRGYCWGADNAGQLGVSPFALSSRCAISGFSCSLLPVFVTGWRLLQDITAGQGDHTCALTLAGSVYCWGAGSMGQLGTGRLSNEWAPARVQRREEPLM